LDIVISGDVKDVEEGEDRMGAEGQDTPIGVVLMENLTKALLKNTEAQDRAAKAYSEVAEELAALREDIEELGGVTSELLGHMTTYLRILDHVAMASLERPPKWKDVQEVLREIKDELQQAEEEAEREARAAQPPTPAPAAPSGEIFPRRKS
jgi:uncharacterized membrane-anchored protein YhcB (DUF1043 family)